MKTRRQFLKLALSAAALGPALATRAVYGEPAASAPWRWGISADFSGSAQKLGLGMRTGIEAAIAEINAAGGLLGAPIQLFALDDGYEPSRTAPNMYKLIDEDKVFAVVGNVGTPTAAVSVPIANKKETIFWGAFTGAGLLRKSPPDPAIFNYRASYAEETAKIVAGLIDEAGIKPEQIGFFTQNDAYGDSGYLGAVKYLKSRGFNDADFLPHGRYTRNTLDVEYGLATLLDPRNDVKAVIMVGTSPPCAKFIKLAKQHEFKAHFIAVSFVGSDQLLNLLGPELAQDVIVSQVVPHPEHSTLPIVQRFRQALPDASKRSFVSLEGYIAAHTLAQAIETAQIKTNDRKAFIQKAQAGLTFDVGLKTPLTLSESEHQLSHSVWPTIIQAGQIESLVSWSSLNAKR